MLHGSGIFSRFEVGRVAQTLTAHDKLPRSCPSLGTLRPKKGQNLGKHPHSSKTPYIDWGVVYSVPHPIPSLGRRHGAVEGVESGTDNVRIDQPRKPSSHQ